MEAGTKRKLAMFMATALAVAVLSGPVWASEGGSEDQKVTEAAEADADGKTSTYELKRVVSSDVPYTWGMPTGSAEWTPIEGEAGKYECIMPFWFYPSDGEQYIILESGKKLTMTMESTNNWELIGESGNNPSITYDAHFLHEGKPGGDALENGSEIISVTTSDDGGQAGTGVLLIFQTKDAAFIADAYSDTLTLTANIVDDNFTQQN